MKIRRLIVALFAGSLLSAGGILSAAERVEVTGLSPEEVVDLFEGDPGVEWEPGQVIVKFKEDSALGIESGDEFDITADEEIMGLGFDDQPTFTSGGEVVLSFTEETMITMSQEDSADLIQEAVDTLNGREDVEYAQLNYVFHPFLDPIDPHYAAQWHYHDRGNGAGQSPGGINLPTAWDQTIGDQTVVVAVIDTGILPNHADIDGSTNIVAGFDMITSPFRANDGDGRDADPTDAGDAVVAGECRPGSRARSNSWHGTHVAGTVGVGHTNNNEGVAGVGWQVSVQNIRVLGKCGGSGVDISDAIRWAAGLAVPGVTPNATPAHVINMSLGAYVPCTQNPGIQAAINDAFNAGSTIVVAAGNDARDAAGAMPAGCDNVITVAAADYNGDLVTRYSNFGTTIEIMAPGGDVLADENGDGNPDGVLSAVQGGYAYYNGTSMAAPHVAGVAALLLTQEPALSPTEVQTRLMAEAIPRSNAQCPQPCGAGLLNANMFGAQDPLQISASPASVDLVDGESQDVVFTLTRGGTPEPSLPVTVSSNDPAVATVVLAQATTDNNGQVTATVTGKSVQTTSIVLNAAGETGPVQVKVRKGSSASGWVSLLLLLALLWPVVRYRNLRTNTGS